MKTIVGCELRVKRGHKNRTLTSEHRYTLVRGNHLDGSAHSLDLWSSNEHGMKRRIERWYLDVSFETVYLSAVAIAPNRNVDSGEAHLIGSAIEHLGGEQNHAGTRTEYSKAVGDALAKGTEQSRGREQTRHCGAFAARHDQCSDAIKVSGDAHLPTLHSTLSERSFVRGERTL